MGKRIKYRVSVDIAVLEFLWSKLGQDVEPFQLIDEILENLGGHEDSITHHINALLVEGLVKLKKQNESGLLSIIEITPSGLQALRSAKVTYQVDTKKSIHIFSWWR